MVSARLPLAHDTPVPDARPIQRDPYRLFFPLGMALGFAGVGHWLLYALGWVRDYRTIFHAMTQIQGFLICFAIGFLFTMIPRRTQSHPPTFAELGVAAVAPVATTAFAFAGAFAWSQLFWLVACGTILRFLFLRARGMRRRPPDAFVWIPIAFAMGVAGSVLAGVGAALGASRWWLHQLGQTLVLQGMFLALVIGVGSLAIPLMTRGVAPPDGGDASARRVHFATAAALLVTFVLEARGLLVLAYALRGALILTALIAVAEIHRRPTQRGWNRRLIWLSAWAIPLGYLLAAILGPGYAKAALHVSFIAGLAALTFAVSAHVTLGHGGRPDALTGRPPAVLAMGALLALATVARLLVALDPARYALWMASAAGSFVLAGLVWSVSLSPLRHAPSSGTPART